MFQYNIQNNIQIPLCLTLLCFSIAVYIPQWDFPCEDEGPFHCRRGICTN